MSLNSRIKRKKEIREECISQNSDIFRLADETLLSVFKYFTTDQLILAAGFDHWYMWNMLWSDVLIFVSASVCKRFRRIAYDDEFWRTIDLTSKTFSSRALAKFFRRFPRTCTEQLKICGKSTIRTNRSHLVTPPPFTEQLATLIRLSYPNLCDLSISRYDFRDDPSAVKSVTYLPGNLRCLHLKQCEMLLTAIPGTIDFLKSPSCTLKNSSENFSLRQLEVLSFENSSCLRLSSLAYLPLKCPNLIELNLNGCYRISRGETFTNILLTYSATLRRLYLRETQIDDDTVHCMCRKLKRLNTLDITSCRYITEHIVDNLLTLKQLRILLADDTIRMLYEQRRQWQRIVHLIHVRMCDSWWVKQIKTLSDVEKIDHWPASFKKIAFPLWIRDEHQHVDGYMVDTCFIHVCTCDSNEKVPVWLSMFEHRRLLLMPCIHAFSYC
jgi:hypothetical protein